MSAYHRGSVVTLNLDLGSIGICQSRSSIRRLALTPIRQYLDTRIGTRRGTVDLSFHLRSPVVGLSIPAMQKNPPQLGNSRICGKSRPAFRPANIALRESKPRSHSDKSLKHFLSKRPIAIYLRCPGHQLHIVALPRTSWQVTGPPTTNYSLTS